ncbi:MAG TPA: hotdog fold thioesterase, partial [Rhodocyclaceae bacterium]|nr:hotdog fold thioesterase [Rhodocyclaceae bacterium]
CLQENVLRAPMDADVGAIFGWGYPPFRGGPLGWLHTMGFAQTVADLERLAAYGPLFAPCVFFADKKGYEMNLLHELDPDLTGLEQLRAILASGRRSCFADTLIALVDIDDGRVALEATPDLDLYNSIGTVHGGFAATMLDYACSYAVLSKLKPGQNFSTLELKVNYHKAIDKDTGPVGVEFTGSFLFQIDSKVLLC